MTTRNRYNRRAANTLKAIRFETPEWTPCRVGLLPATWMKYRHDLEGLARSYPALFPEFEGEARDFDAIDSVPYELGRHVDCWGTIWENVARGLDGHPVGFPLEDWAAWEGYEPPDPLAQDSFGPRDWEATRRGLERARERGDLAVGGGLQHGFMYMRLYYLRGFENLMLDLARGEPRLAPLIRMVEGYNRAVIERVLELGVDMMHFGDDLGLQDRLPMSPATWRAWIKPSYRRLFRPIREAGLPLYLHTDGHILGIIPDLIDVGVTVLNPQFRANGLQGLREMALGRVALDLDLDRQMFPFATPAEIEEHIEAAHEALALPEGGLMMIAEVGPDVPLENIAAICRALERVRGPGG